MVYNILSRGRTVCMIIDPDIDFESPIPLQNIDVVKWKESNGVFTQLDENEESESENDESENNESEDGVSIDVEIWKRRRNKNCWTIL